ncbi:MFS transporter [Ottowia sp. VDI28]|uniref:MFS transporter n=1 Tax=Ottowia sp. VDI28 TaxID=3133968 RepID=UPI003C2D4772
MWNLLANRTYRHLFAAQVIALVGTGLATVALGLLAFDLAGQDAGMVLGTALAIKMAAYVLVAPVATALAQGLPRRTTLVALDLVRGFVALLLPFVSQIWQIYLLIFILQAASAAFTPLFQATIPEVLPDEREYTKALSLSRLAYDLETLLSPLLAAALLTVIGFHDLFAGTVVGFLASAVLVVSVKLPALAKSEKRSIYERTTRGLRVFLATPRLRGLLAVNGAAAAAVSMVFVNTVFLVQARWGMPQSSVALALAAFGAGSIVVALALPPLLERWPDRPVMLLGVASLAVTMLLGSFFASYPVLLVLWFLAGAGYSAAMTPTGRVIRRSAAPSDRPALFAAQFALSHGCWLLFYPLAGWAGARLGVTATFLMLGLFGAAATALAWRIWPEHDPEIVEHTHADLPVNASHLEKESAGTGVRHAHAYFIDDLHPSWPRS